MGLENGAGGKRPFLWRASGLNPILTQVLERSSNDPGIGDTISDINRLCFLEGPWLLALSHRDFDSRLVVFNTLLPQQNPRSWRILELPVPSHGYYWFAPRYDLLAERPEFSVDPAQRIFVVHCLRFAIVIPVEPFTREMTSACANTYLQWEEWGVYAIKSLHHPNAPTLQLVDMRILSLHITLLGQTDFCVDMYDHSKSSQRDIRRTDGWMDEGYAGVLSTPKWSAKCQMEEPPITERFMGNKLVCFYVSLSKFSLLVLY